MALTACSSHSSNVIKPDTLDSLDIIKIKSFLDGGQLNVVAILENTGLSASHIYYRYVWKNKAGNPIGLPSPWQMLHLSSGQRAYIKGQSVEDDALGYTLEFSDY